MEAKYITTDFEFESSENLSNLVLELEESLVPQLNQFVGEKYCVSLSGTGSEIYNQPEQTIIEFCGLIENISEPSQELWRSCSKRLAYIAFESGSENVTYTLSESLISRLEKLKIGIEITIYPLGKYFNGGGGEYEN